MVSVKNNNNLFWETSTPSELKVPNDVGHFGLNILNFHFMLKFDS